MVLKEGQSPRNWFLDSGTRKITNLEAMTFFPSAHCCWDIMDSMMLIAMKHKVPTALVNTAIYKPECMMMENYISIRENVLQPKIS